MKQSRWVPTLLLPLYLQAFHHFATWPKVDQIDWRRPSLIVGTKVWSQDDPMRHSDKLQSLTFPGLPFRVFNPPGFPFLPKPPFRVFDLSGVQIFHFHPLFFLEPFWFAGKPLFLPRPVNLAGI